MIEQKVGAAMIVGGGIGGMQAALDLAESGIKVYIVEKSSAIGGVMAMLDKTFPTNDCAMCTMAPRLVSIGRHKDIEVISLATVERVEGEAGNFKVRIKKNPRYVDEDKCTGCGSCIENCPTYSKVQPLETPKVKLDEGFEKVKEIVEKHKNRKGPLMPILQEINATFNWLPENALRYVAQETGYPLTHILRIATFYSAFSITPRGKNIINICTGTTCYVKGAERLMDKFKEILQIDENETTKDKLFTLKQVRCIGCCGLAPAIMINDMVYGKLVPKDVPDILKKYKEAS
jgi:NADH:ubiquinone oxidoreductase subunit E/NAD-dependent dihydropyrimidine dehydrogenase PreA subunit